MVFAKHGRLGRPSPLVHTHGQLPGYSLSAPKCFGVDCCAPNGDSPSRTAPTGRRAKARPYQSPITAGFTSRHSLSKTLSPGHYDQTLVTWNRDQQWF